MIQGLTLQLKLNLLYMWKSYYSSNAQSHPSLLKNCYGIYVYKVGTRTLISRQMEICIILFILIVHG